MSKAQGINKKAPAERGLKREYRFDYAKARPNRFASAYKTGSRVVVLDPDVAKVFKDSSAVNTALRALKRPMKSAM